MLAEGVPEHIRSDNRAEMIARIVRNLIAKLRAKTLYIASAVSMGKRLLRVLQRRTARRMPER